MEKEIKEFQAWALARNWKALVAPCVPGKDLSSRSAGVAILVRSYIGLGWIDIEPLCYKGRAIIAQVQVPGAPPSWSSVRIIGIAKASPLITSTSMNG